MKNFTVAMIALATLALSVNAEARRGHKGPPPQAAIDACKGSEEGASCTMTGKNDESLEGKCKTVPSGEFACVPKRHKHDKEGKGRGSPSNDDAKGSDGMMN